MRMTVISIVCMCCVLFCVVIQSSVNSRAIHEAEIRDGLKSALKQTMCETMRKNGNTIHSKSEFRAALLQGLICKLNSDADLTVRIYTLDLENGFADVEAEETFRYMNQKKKVVSVRRAVMIEQKE